ncbi:glycosyltransferase family 4 protein [Hypnocyclicus thermotrophus]|uniref:glycosyltransferase family 4 protein n=1 Tax=Hypnocyclicus thermotrophus TaxID=1627895 RepID=UPI0014170A45|nr:glycosyltransferase family 4 protein [Hypnocyclicus thermotrophus]
MLFVGSYFFANIEGITWFVKNVMPEIEGKLYIVGKGMEKLREELSRENVEVVGGVEDLAEYYYNANFIVAPIFSGSGMKVKTAEALMYGKTIFGTKEAFEGYELEFGKIGEECNSRDEFIEKINQYINDKKIEKFNKFSRNNYLEKYSNNILKEGIKNLFKEL